MGVASLEVLLERARRPGFVTSGGAAPSTSRNEWVHQIIHATARGLQSTETMCLDPLNAAFGA
jgi:hypothetical protein